MILSQSTNIQYLLDVPKVNPQSAYCTMGVFEAMAKYLFGLRDLQKLYAWHGFSYSRPGSEIAFATGHELNIELTRKLPENYETILFDGMRKHYGIALEAERVGDMAELSDLIIGHLAHGEPLACEFSLGFMKGKKEYGLKFAPHTIMVCGFDPTRQSIQAKSQFSGGFEVDREDLANSIAYAKKLKGGLTFYSMSRPGVSAGLSREDALDRITGNLANLSSGSPNTGLNALSGMLRDVDEFLARKSPPSFSLPGIWAFGNERFAVSHWVKEVRSDLRLEGGALIEDFVKAFNELGNQWTLISWMFDHGLEMGEPTAFTRAYEMIRKLQGRESKSISKWESLRELLLRAA